MRLRNAIALAALVAGLALLLPAPAAAGPDDTLFAIPLPGTRIHGVRIHTDQNLIGFSLRNFMRFTAGVTFSQLQSIADNGVIVYCADCTQANPCAAGGGGALAKRLAQVWVCN